MNALAKIQQAGFTLSLYQSDCLTVRPASKLTQKQRYYLTAHKTEIISELLTANDEADSYPLMKFGVLEVKIFRACSARGDDWEHIKEMIIDCRHDYPPEKWPGLWEYFDKLEKRWQ